MYDPAYHAETEEDNAVDNLTNPLETQNYDPNRWGGNSAYQIDTEVDSSNQNQDIPDSR